MLTTLLLRVRAFFIDLLEVGGEAGEDWTDDDTPDISEGTPA